MPVDNISNTVMQTVQPYDIRWNELFKEEENAGTTQVAVKSPFESFYNAAIDALDETNSFQLAADKQQQDLATGKTSDILAVLLAQDKAYSTLNFTVQVTNKVIESYREIMRMQI